MAEYIEQRIGIQANSVVAKPTEYIDKQALLDEFEKWNFGKHGQLEKHFADRVFAIIDEAPPANVAPIADTVRKMQERLNKFFGGTCQSDVALRSIFDQIAKEMVEEVTANGD